MIGIYDDSSSRLPVKELYNGVIDILELRKLLNKMLEDGCIEVSFIETELEKEK